MIKIIFIILPLLFSGLVLAKDKADFNLKYNSKTGEFSMVMPNLNNGFDGYGYNMRTNQMWFNQIDARGARGVDPFGNYWMYDPKTGNYINSNGRMCKGLGEYRRCN